MCILFGLMREQLFAADFVESAPCDYFIINFEVFEKYVTNELFVQSKVHGHKHFCDMCE